MKKLEKGVFSSPNNVVLSEKFASYPNILNLKINIDQLLNKKVNLATKFTEEEIQLMLNVLDCSIEKSVANAYTIDVLHFNYLHLGGDISAKYTYSTLLNVFQSYVKQVKKYTSLADLKEQIRKNNTVKCSICGKLIETDDYTVILSNNLLKIKGHKHNHCK